MTDNRLQLWSCGGGRQSAGIAALIVEGQLPPPDHVAMVRLEWEVATVWRYVDAYIRPALAKLGITFTAVSRKKYATKDFFGGEDGNSVLLPVHTNQSGEYSKLPEWCSGEWKREVVMRWAAGRRGWKGRGVDCWVGISRDEAKRRTGPRKKWFQPTYPLLDVRPTHVGGCLEAVKRLGWPPPPRSRCYHCPNQSDAEWLELTPKEFRLACETEDAIRAVDPHAYFHKSLVPLRMVVLNATADNGGLFGGCSSGMCY